MHPAEARQQARQLFRLIAMGGTPVPFHLLQHDDIGGRHRAGDAGKIDRAVPSAAELDVVGDDEHGGFRHRDGACARDAC